MKKLHVDFACHYLLKHESRSKSFNEIKRKKNTPQFTVGKNQKYNQTVVETKVSLILLTNIYMTAPVPSLVHVIQ